MTPMLLPYLRYVEVSGRSRRAEFWLFMLFQLVVSIGIGIVFGTSGHFESEGYGTNFVSAWTLFDSTGMKVQALFNLLNIIPNLTVSVRRLHDQDRSAWLLLLVFLPVLGWFTLFVLMCLPGTRGPNRFGPDPANPHYIATFR